MSLQANLSFFKHNIRLPFFVTLFHLLYSFQRAIYIYLSSPDYVFAMFQMKHKNKYKTITNMTIHYINMYTVKFQLWIKIYLPRVFVIFIPILLSTILRR